MFKTSRSNRLPFEPSSPPAILLGSSPPQPSDLSKAVSRWKEMQCTSFKKVPVTVLKDLNTEYN